MSDTMIITIIIPVYNVDKYIEHCLQSLINQTYTKGIECIIVNDCSTDTSLEIIESILSNYNGNINFKLINHKKNLGLSAARNTGIKNALGKYLYFLDSDDFITYNCIELFIKKLSLYDYDLIISDYQTSNNIKYYPSLNVKKDCFNDEILYEYVNGNIYMMAWNKLIKKSIIIDNNLYFKENIIHEDDLWSFISINYIKTLGIINECTYNYRIVENSIMKKKHIPGRHIKSYIEITNEFLIFLRNHRNEYNESFILNYMFSTLLGAYNHEIKNMFEIAWYKFQSTYKLFEYNFQIQNTLRFQTFSSFKISLFIFSFIIPKSLGYLYAKFYFRTLFYIKKWKK